MHEGLTPKTEVKVGSERSFGLVFAALFMVVALLPLVKGDEFRPWLALIGLVFGALGLARPAALRPLNLLWFQFGLLLNKVVSPVVMALLYCLTILPLAVSARLAGKDLLRLKADPSAASYWIKHSPRGPASETMRNQF